jgi:hypothetical protein
VGDPVGGEFAISETRWTLSRSSLEGIGHHQCLRIACACHHAIDRTTARLNPNKVSPKLFSCCSTRACPALPMATTQITAAIPILIPKTVRTLRIHNSSLRSKRQGHFGEALNPVPHKPTIPHFDRHEMEPPRKDGRCHVWESKILFVRRWRRECFPSAHSYRGLSAGQR